MKALLALLLLLVDATSSASASATSNDVDDVAVAESSKAFSLLLPAVALPYAIALVAIVVPLAKAFVAHALKLLNLPFEGMVALYLVLYAALFTFPQLASLLTATSVFTARAASGEGPAAAAHQFPMSGTLLDWMRNFVPGSWADVMSAALPALTKSPTTPSYTTLPGEMTTPTVTEATSPVATAQSTSTTTSTTPPTTTVTKGPSTTSNVIEEELESPAVQGHRVVLPEIASSSPRCSSFKVCESVSRLVKDYPVSAMLMSYLGDYLQGLKYERAVREGMAGLDCSAIYTDCQ